MDDYGHVDASHEYADLDHGQAEYSADHDHALNAAQYGEATHHEADQHYAHGEAEHYESPHGEEHDRQEYTNFDGHEADSHAEFGSQLSEFEHNSAFQGVDQLHQELSADHFDATRFDGGEGEISAVSR